MLQNIFDIFNAEKAQCNQKLDVILGTKVVQFWSYPKMYLKKKWPNRGRDRPTQPKVKVPSVPIGNGQVLVPELDFTAENQFQADLPGGAQTADAQPGG